MSETTHTPGPWMEGSANGGRSWFVVSGPARVATIPPSSIHRKADARLIAAAPTMLEALKQEVCSCNCPETCCGKMRAAIKLAEGDQ